MIGIIDCIDNTIVTLTGPIVIMAGKFLAAWRVLIAGKTLKSFGDALKILFGQRAQLPFSRFLDDQAIGVHRA